jgi:hypothetical protein
MMLRAAEGLPVNLGILAKGSSAGEAALAEQVLAGAAGFKIHEDWGATLATIRAALSVADRMDVQVSVHTDTLNEAGFVEDTIAAFDGRTIHTFHSEGAGGGHSPDLLRVAGEDNVLPSSTNPTLPFGHNTQAELFDMIMVVHNLNPRVSSDVAFAESRVRAETIAAENVLHDLGAISMFSSDSQAMGRVGENWLRVMQTADAMARFPDSDVVLIESGGDNLTLTFSPALVDFFIYVIDVAAGDKIPRKNGPGIAQSDILVINKTDLAPYVHASLKVMDADSRQIRGGKPFVFTNCLTRDGIAGVMDLIMKNLLFDVQPAPELTP